MTFRAAALATALSVLGVAQAAQTPGPFGLRFGMTAAQAIAMGATRDPNLVNTYNMTSPPKGNSAFSTYMLRISPTKGLCSVIAVTPDIQGDSSGLLTRIRFSSLRASLTSIYGRPTKTTDSLKPGSSYAQPSKWMSAVLVLDRTYSADWDLQGGAKLPASYSFVVLEVAPTGPTTGSISLDYGSSRPHCNDDINNADKTGL